MECVGYDWIGLEWPGQERIGNVNKTTDKTSVVLFFHYYLNEWKNIILLTVKMLHNYRLI